MNSSKDSLPFWCAPAPLPLRSGALTTIPEIARMTGLSEDEVLSAYRSGLRKIRLHRSIIPKFQSAAQLLDELRSGRGRFLLL